MLFVVIFEILVKGMAAAFCEQRLQHHVLAAAFGKVSAISFPQRRNPGIAVLLVDLSALVAVSAVQCLPSHCKSSGEFIRESSLHEVPAKSSGRGPTTTESGT